MQNDLDRFNGAQQLSEPPATDQASQKAEEKRLQKEKRRVAGSFTLAMSKSIQLLEHTMQHGTAAGKEAAKQRRKQVKEVVKAVTDSSSSLEERLILLQKSYVQAVEQLTKQDSEKLQLQAALDAAAHDRDSARAKVDSLQRLARSLQTESRAKEAEAAANFELLRSSLEDIQAKIASQASESEQVYKHNTALAEENRCLRAKEAATEPLLAELQRKLQALQTTQAQQLQDLAEKLEQQSDVIEKSRKAQEHMGVLLQENNVLRVKAATADELKERNDLLEALIDQYKQQAAQSISAIKELDSKQRDGNKVFKVLMAERDKLQQLVKLQAGEATRLKQQKERLEGLCRALQERTRGLDQQAVGAEAAEAASVEAALDAVVPEEMLRIGDGAGVEIIPECAQLVSRAVATVVAINS